MVKKYSQVYLDARKRLLQTEEPEMASQLARHLLCYVSGKTNEQLLADRELYASQQVVDEMESMAERIVQGEPMAYILGEWSFYGLNFHVDRHVLIPRDDTCAVAELAIRYGQKLGQDARILDLCTGSGCIGIAVASRVKDARVTLADVSREALAVAKKNIVRHRLSSRVTCVQADALKHPGGFLGKFDLIVSNPPYITGREMQELDRSVADFEPHLALYGGEDGLDFYRSIGENYRDCLKDDGFLALEFGMGQGDAVCEILEKNGFTVLERVRDFNERERAVLAQYGRKEEK